MLPEQPEATILARVKRALLTVLCLVALWVLFVVVWDDRSPYVQDWIKYRDHESLTKVFTGKIWIFKRHGYPETRYWLTVGQYRDVWSAPQPSK